MMSRGQRIRKTERSVMGVIIAQCLIDHVQAARSAGRYV
jgi:hypothetical protein